MNAHIGIASSSWPQDRFGPETAHWLPRGKGQDLDHIPGKDGWPVIGNTFELINDYNGFVRQMFEQFGPV